MFGITIYGVPNPITEDSSGFVLKTALSAADNIELECSFINYEYDLKSDSRTIAGNNYVNDNIFRDGINITTDRYLLKDFGDMQKDLIDILRNKYLYVSIDNYSFEPFSDTLAMPVVIESYSLNWSKGYKWFTIKMVKANGKT